ncbi:hypothetical protein D9M68_754970 [compost metagenome]
MVIEVGVEFEQTPSANLMQTAATQCRIRNQVRNARDLFQKPQERQRMQLVEQVAGHRSELRLIGTDQLDFGLAVVVVPVNIARLGKLLQHGVGHVFGQKVVECNMGEGRPLLVFDRTLCRQGGVFRVIKNKPLGQSFGRHCVLLDTCSLKSCREPSQDLRPSRHRVK